MGKHTRSESLDLGTYEVPDNLVALYDALQAANGAAIQSVKRGERRVAREWRLASRLCREFLSATEEPAQLAYAAQLGDWNEARTADEPPENPYTYQMWLAAQAWRLLQCCTDRELDAGHIEPVRHCAREGIIAIKTVPVFQRVFAQREVNGESKIEDRERGPEFGNAGNKPGLRLVRSDE